MYERVKKNSSVIILNLIVLITSLGNNIPLKELGYN